MTTRMIVPLMFGLIGAAILVWLGTWQMQRLAWKQSLLAEIDARMVAAPVALPDAPDATADQYLPVAVTGVLDPAYIRVLVSQKQIGAGYRIISPLTVGDRRILVDRGFMLVEDQLPALPTGPVTFSGNLLWPVEVDAYTPAPDLGKNIWFARDLPAMAAALDTEPMLIVARQGPDGGVITPLPIDGAGIPNDHLNYAITWYSLAVVWLGMTGFLLWRIRRQAV
jgi:surfeit locus 1 family protein